MTNESSSDEHESSQRISKDAAFAEARALVRARRHGVLSTLSQKEHGWPFGSVVPFGLTAEGEPILYLARIAEHHRNIMADDRVCLFVHDPSEREGEDVQVHGRVSLLGHASRVEDADRAELWARYRARLPQAEGYSATHGFDLFRVALTRVRYIGGFGKIFWLDAERFRLDPSHDPLRSVSAEVIEHMNDDHEEALLTYCRGLAKVSPGRARLVAVDQYGLDVVTEAPDLRLRFEFPEPATTQTIRGATIALLAQARAHL